METEISITGIGSISPLGTLRGEIWDAYLQKSSLITSQKNDENSFPVAKIPNHLETLPEKLREIPHYKSLDRSVLFAILASRSAVADADWNESQDFGINFGSSRGATSLFEKYHEEFLDKGYAATLSSPTTTLGNISTWIAQDLKSKGPVISHSITCSTALHALLNGIAWLTSGMTDKFLVGGSEAPLTPFTIAQMKALKIYARETDADYPCKSLDLQKKKNTMVLGEGATAICLEKGIRKNALALISGVGFATETLSHSISISADAICFQESMKMALGNQSPSSVDAIVMHAPGTIKGDQSEYNAIQKVFKTKPPALTTNKWKIGHTFGASGMLSLELGLLMLKHQKFIPVPFLENKAEPKQIQKVLVNAVGFGGNAVSVLVESIR